MIGFSKSAKNLPLGSWLIRAYQNTEYSHVYIRIPKTIYPTDTILHASEGKVHKMSETQFDKRHRVVKEYSINISEELYNKVKEEIHEISGDDYGIMQNIGIALVDVMRILFGKKIQNPWISGWNCSEFVMRILKIIFPIEFINTDPNTVTPKYIDKKLAYLAEKALISPINKLI